ncbi:MAG TPA: GntR family transcriptional regulator [Kribbella sp.]
MSPSRHDEVAEELRSRIRSGQIVDVLPTMEELGEDFHVGRATIRRALQTLTGEGLIEGRSGQLKRVRRENRMEWSMATLELRRTSEDGWADDVRERGQTPSVEIAIHLTPADQETAAALEIELGAQTLQQSGLRRVDGHPHHLTDTYFPRWLVDAHAEFATSQDPSTHGALLNAAGLSQAYYDDDITARMPGPEETQQLKISPGVPLLIHARTAYDADDRPLRYVRSRVPADRVNLRYQVKA